MKILVIDGKGGRLGGGVVEMLKKTFESFEIYAVGTNVMATTQMMKSGADFGATGENPVIVNCRDAKIIVAPIGITMADSFLGEVTAKIAVAVGSSSAFKILIPNNKCNHFIVGVKEQTATDFIDGVKEKIMQILSTCI